MGNPLARGTNGLTSAIYFDQKYSYATIAIAFLLIAYQSIPSHGSFGNRIPYHRNSSAIISAMCHVNDPYELRRQYSDEELWEISGEPLIWGVTREPAGSDGTGVSEDVPGHYSFSPSCIGLPVKGNNTNNFQYASKAVERGGEMVV